MTKSDPNFDDARSEQAELLNFVVAAIERVGLRYAITGSHATIAYGENRFTNDIDVALEISEAKLAELLAQFPPGRFYISDQGARDAASRGGQFNIIDEETFQKVDFVVPREPNWPNEFDNRIQLPIDTGRTAWFMGREDLILRKMQAYEEGGSDKHLRDIASMFRAGAAKINREYISTWASALGYEEIWKLIQKSL